MAALIYLPSSGEICPKYYHRLGQGYLRFRIVLWKVTKTIHERCTKYIGQVLAMYRAHALWIIAVLRLIVENVEVTASRLCTRSGRCWRRAATWAAAARYGRRRIGGQLVTGAYDGRYELRIRQRCHSGVACINRVLRRTIPVGVLVNDLRSG